MNSNLNIPSFIIVLGNPSPRYYEERVDRGMKEMMKMIEENKIVKVIMAGGNGESSKLKKYALDKYGNQYDNFIIEESQSLNTYQNLLFSKEIIEKMHYIYSIIVCTSTFHINRSIVLTHFIFRNRPCVTIQSIHTDSPIPEDRRVREKMLLDNLMTYLVSPQ